MSTGIYLFGPKKKISGPVKVMRQIMKIYFGFEPSGQ